MKLTRKQFEEAVDGSDLNPYARLVCLTYARKADYRDSAQEVWPSQAWVSQVTGINKDIVGKYVKALVEDGWLIPAKMHGRAQGFYLGHGVLMNRTLAKARRGRNLRMESEQCPDGVDTQILMEQTSSPDGQDLITKNNHIEVTKEEPTTVSNEPVASPKVEASPLVIEQEDVVNYKEMLENLEPPLDIDEREARRRMLKDRHSYEYIYNIITQMREEGW